MRISKLGFVFAVVLLATANLSFAQCTQALQNNYISCSNPVCNNSVTSHTPWAPGPYGLYFVCGSVSCCGQSYPDCHTIPQSCNGSGRISDPNVRKSY
jgi:hypothetical protein